MEHIGKKIERSTGTKGTQKSFAGENIIFLDVDGVLNCVSTPYRICGLVGIDMEKVRLLKKIVEFYKCKIILSSSWKNSWEAQDEFGSYLTECLDAEGLEISDMTHDHGMDRGWGIKEWIEKHGPLKWYAILDDEMFDFKKEGIAKHWVQTSFYGRGLTEKHFEYMKKNESLFIEKTANDK